MSFSFFFFSSRRRHTRCALVTGVQTCALPICRCRGLLPDACSHSREHDGDGPWWLQVRRLLEARTPDVVVVPDSCNGVDPSDLEFLMCSPKVLSEVYESIGREGRKISRRSMFAALGTGEIGRAHV